MIHQCSNPNCGKPLHYLREGRVFVFHLADPSATVIAGRPIRRLEHFWLCGSCSATMMMVQASDTEIELQQKLITVAS